MGYSDSGSLLLPQQQGASESGEATKARKQHERKITIPKSHPHSIWDLFLYVSCMLSLWDRWFQPELHHDEAANTGITRQESSHVMDIDFSLCLK